MYDKIINYKISDAFQTVNTGSVEIKSYNLEVWLKFDGMIEKMIKF